MLSASYAPRIIFDARSRNWSLAGVKGPMGSRRRVAGFFLFSTFVSAVCQGAQGRRVVASNSTSLALAKAVNGLVVSKGGYIVVPLQPEYIADLAMDSSVEIYSEQELERHQVIIQNGRLYAVSGEPLDTRAAPDGHFLFVMFADGRIYATAGEAGRIHHTTLSAGLPLAAAGELQVINGELVFLSDKGRRYKPPRFASFQALRQLSRQGVRLSNRVALDIYQPVSPQDESACTRLLTAGVPPERLGLTSS